MFITNCHSHPSSRRTFACSFWVWFITLLVASRSQLSSSQAAEPKIDFNRDIRPILSDNCFSSHGPDKDRRKAGLRLDVRADALQKLESGEVAIVPGKPAESRLLKVVALPVSDDDCMPPAKTGKKLSSSQIDTLRQWIAAGANYSEHWA